VAVVGVIPQLSIDAGYLIGQLLFSIFLTDWPEPEINTHTTVLLVDDAATVTIYSDAGSACARHDVLPAKDPIIVGALQAFACAGINARLSRPNDAGGRDSTSLISEQRGQLQAISLIRPLTQRLIHPITVARHHLEGRVDDLARASAGEQSPDAEGAK
jgi:hypothetical protein